jgi:hypothetical protein
MTAFLLLTAAAAMAQTGSGARLAAVKQAIEEAR